MVDQVRETGSVVLSARPWPGTESGQAVTERHVAVAERHDQAGMLYHSPSSWKQEGARLSVVCAGKCMSLGKGIADVVRAWQQAIHFFDHQYHVKQLSARCDQTVRQQIAW